MIDEEALVSTRAQAIKDANNLKQLEEIKEIREDEPVEEIGPRTIKPLDAITEINNPTSKDHPVGIKIYNCGSGSANRRYKYATLGYSPLQLLHHRWGHASESMIKRTLQLKGVQGAGVAYDEIKNESLPYCDTCHKGKINPVTTTVYAPFQKIDIHYFKGPITPMSINKYNGFYLLSDNNKHYLKAYLTNSKTTELEVLKDFQIELYLCHLRITGT